MCKKICKLLFFTVFSIFILLIGIEGYFYFNQNKTEKSNHLGQHFHLINYIDVHHPQKLIKFYHENQTKKIYLVYDFDTLNSVNRINTYLNTKSIKSDFENFISFISYVIHNYNHHNTVIIVRISSPGGDAYKFAKLYTSIKRLNNRGFKTIAFIDDICASGGYMIACAFDEVYASYTSQIGSIGVTTTHTNYNGLLEKFGIKEKTFGTGKYKGMNNFNGDSNLEHQYDIFEENLDYTLQMFLKIVGTRKNVNLTHITSAKMWYGEDALELGLIDDIVNMDDYLYDLSIDFRNGVYYVVSFEREEKKSIDLFSLLRIILGF